jgi:UDP-N-acetylmuramyl pentapeptide synthase
MDKVRRRLPEAIAGVRNVEIIAGDNSTTLLYDPAKTSLTAITNDLEMMAHLPGKHKFMLTGGIKELGKYKHDVYPELAKLIHQTVDVLITYDQDLAHAAKQNNTSTEVIAVKSVDELLTAVRQRLSPQDLILINSDIDTTVLAALRSDR